MCVCMYTCTCTYVHKYVIKFYVVSILNRKNKQFVKKISLKALRFTNHIENL